MYLVLTVEFDSSYRSLLDHTTAKLGFIDSTSLRDPFFLQGEEMQTQGARGVLD